MRNMNKSCEAEAAQKTDPLSDIYDNFFKSNS